jgi:predicted GNAT family acetyltransferase
MLQPSFNPVLADDNYDYTPDNRAIEAEVIPVKVESPNVFAALDRLEETLLNSPRVPLTGKTVVNEDELLEQIDAIRLNLPDVVAMAQEILQYKEQIIRDAQQQVQQILADANQRAYHVANELGIIERSEREAHQLRQVALAECEQLRQQAVAEVERVRHHNIQEIDRMRQKTAIECQQIQDGADEYADRILHNMEHQLSDILQAIQRGRQKLDRESVALRQNESTVPELASRVDERSHPQVRELQSNSR